MELQTFKAWLREYERAWEERDPEGASQLFAEDALYFWTPLEEPKRGRAQIAQAWREATNRQRNVRFDFEIVSVNGQKGVARWWCELHRHDRPVQAKIDGVMIVTLRPDGLCQFFNEWWHMEEEEIQEDG